MRKAKLIACVASLGAACSPAPPGGNGVGNGGDSGSSGSGGVITTGGTSSGGISGTGAVITGGASGSAGTSPVCDELMVSSEPLTPTVLILVDNSSSMYEPREQLWDALYTALMSPTMGAVKPLEGKVLFGFASYRGVDNISVPESDDSCAQIETVGTVTQATVGPALNNHAAIDTVYRALGVQGRDPNNAQWETPTGHALRRTAANLAAFTADPPGPKYILLVTDGNPNTCLVGDPQCGSDQSVKAAQDAFAAGIGTIPLGIGDIVSTNTGCMPTTAFRCGALHLQDMANAGSGLPVEPPPMDYWYQQCATRQSNTNPGTPIATYAAPGMGGTAPYFTAADPAEILTKLTTLLSNVISCTLDMDALVTGNAALGTVLLTPDQQPQRPLAINDMANGWVLEPNNYQVTLTGQACTDYKAGNADLHITFPCTEAEPR